MAVHLTLSSASGLLSTLGADAAGNSFAIDLSGGKAAPGMRPMQLLPLALAACAMADITGILEKQRQELTAYTIRITAEREDKELPALWKAIHLAFELQGRLDPARAEKAIALSLDKYCSVAETLKRGGTTITFSLETT